MVFMPVSDRLRLGSPGSHRGIWYALWETDGFTYSLVGGDSLETDVMYLIAP